MILFPLICISVSVYFYRMEITANIWLICGIFNYLYERFFHKIENFFLSKGNFFLEKGFLFFLCKEKYHDMVWLVITILVNYIEDSGFN